MKDVVRPADAALHMEPDTSQTPNLRPNLNIEVCNKVRRLTTGGCRNYGPFLDSFCNTAPNISGTPKRDHNFDNHPYVLLLVSILLLLFGQVAHRGLRSELRHLPQGLAPHSLGFRVEGLGFKV